MVVGEADGERLLGEVVETSAQHHASGEVCVRWTGEVYDTNECGVVEASLLVLWPSRAHAARIAEVSGGS
jgi:hypothetical protein